MSTNENAVLPDTSQTVNFYGDRLVLIQIKGKPFVSLKPIANFLGLNWSAQYRRTLRDDVLVQHIALNSMRGTDGKQYKMISLELEYLPGWLVCLSTSKVRPEVAEKLTRYRYAGFLALARGFQHTSFQSEDDIKASSASLAILQEVREVGLSVARTIEKQLEIERRRSVIS